MANVIADVIVGGLIDGQRWVDISAARATPTVTNTNPSAKVTGPRLTHALNQQTRCRRTKQGIAHVQTSPRDENPMHLRRKSARQNGGLLDWLGCAALNMLNGMDSFSRDGRLI